MFAIARLTGMKMIREKGQGYSSLLQTVGCSDRQPMSGVTEISYHIW
jgi:hypothetical protein